MRAFAAIKCASQIQLNDNNISKSDFRMSWVFWSNLNIEHGITIAVLDTSSWCFVNLFGQRRPKRPIICNRNSMAEGCTNKHRTIAALKSSGKFAQHCTTVLLLLAKFTHPKLYRNEYWLMCTGKRWLQLDLSRQILPIEPLIAFVCVLSLFNDIFNNSFVYWKLQRWSEALEKYCLPSRIAIIFGSFDRNIYIFLHIWEHSIHPKQLNWLT